MTFSRSHLGMVGIIGLFTGVIAPVFSDGNSSYPFAMTSVQSWSYLLLFVLAFGFYTASARKWRHFQVTIGIIFLFIVYVFSVFLTDRIVSLAERSTMIHLGWGWIFLIIGLSCIVYSGFGSSREDDASTISDGIIGIVGSMTLIGLSALIIGASIQSGGHRERFPSMLEKKLGGDYIEYGSGFMQTIAFNEISGFYFDRKNDTLEFFGKNGNTQVFFSSKNHTGTIMQSYTYGKNIITITDAGRWINNTPIEKDVSIAPYKEYAIIEDTKSGKILIHKHGEIVLGKDTPDPILVLSAEVGNIVSWIEQDSDTREYVIKKNNNTIWRGSEEPIYGAISKGGYDTMHLLRGDNNTYISIKNGTTIDPIREGYIPGTWQSNGSHSIYTIEYGSGIKNIIYDGVSIGKDLSEVREVFLERGGNSYAFFGRLTGGDSYCFFSRFRGSTCGLKGYMNPQTGADGSSVIYGGFRDGIWSIYRNSSLVIRDTGYSAHDIRGDYLFFDTTNPKQYVIFQKIAGEKYQIRKNNKVIPGVWEDVGLDVGFGYNNTVYLTAKDEKGWRVLEL